MAKTIDDLEREHAARLAKQAEEVEEDDDESDDDEESFLYNDLVNSVDMLKKCALLLEYMADVELCKNITKRERDIMAKMSDRVYDFVNEVEESHFTEE